MTPPRRLRRRTALILTSESLFPHFFPESTLARLQRIAEWRVCSERRDSARLRSEVAGADALVTTWHSPYLQTAMLGAPRRVRIIAHCGGEIRARMEDRVVEEVTVVNTPDPMAEPAAEMAMAMTLAMIRRLPEYRDSMRAGLEQDNRTATVGESLRGRTVGVVGFGRIGRGFARLIRPFGVDLLVTDPYCSTAAIRRAGAHPATLEDLLRRASVVVLTAALTAETRGMMDRRRLELLPHGACLVNVARGGLIVLDDLLEMLRARRLRAAVDVTDPLEPLPPEHELRHAPGLLLTPHVAAGGLEVRKAMGEAAVRELGRFFRGRAVRNRVTPDMLSSMT